MPKLWNATVETHRATVREAILDTTWRLVTEGGLASVTMSAIAGQAGIGRATLYKYFPDVEAILSAWHQRHVASHLEQLAEIGARGGDASDRLPSMLEAYALIVHHSGHHGPELVALLHRGDDVIRTQRQLANLLRNLLAEAANIGVVRDDVPPDELASYCLHALSAAGDLPSEDAVRRLVCVTVDGMCSASKGASKR